MLDQLTSIIVQYVPQLLGALAILIVGWIVAKIVSAMVRGGLKRLHVDDRLATFLGDGEQKIAVESWVSAATYVIVMLLVIVAASQALGLTLITNPLNQLLGSVFSYLPSLFGAGILLVIAWAVATVVRLLITRVLKATSLDERFRRYVTTEEEAGLPLAETLGDAAYWLIFLLFLPGVLGALQLSGLEPVQQMVSRLLNFLPNLLGAILILAVGWFVARIVQRIVTGFLTAFGVDRLSERAGLAQALGTQRLSSLIGLIIYVLIFIPVILGALDALDLASVTRPVSNMLDAILAAIPAIFGAALVLVVAYFIGRIVSNLIASVLTNLGFDTIMNRLGLRGTAVEGQRTPSEFVGYLILAGFMLFATIEAADLLGFRLVADLVTQFTSFAANIILGLIIFGVGLYIANWAAATIKTSGASHVDLLSRLGRLAIIILSGAMALRQMGIATEIVNLAFGLILGAAAVAAALAFGLGGRELAGRQLEDWVRSARQEKEN